jgi:hypothetical protein
MSNGWQLVIHEPSMRTLLAARAKDRAALFRTLDRLLARLKTKLDPCPGLTNNCRHVSNL